MKTKFLIISILLILIIFGLRKSFAQPVNQCLPAEINNLIKVGISTNDFSSLEYKEIIITSDGNLTITDKSSNINIIKALPKDLIKVEIKNNAFLISQNDKIIAENISGTVEIKPETGFFLQIQGLKRGGKPAAYRGIFEITRTPGKTDKFSIINILSLEEYLKGVVPNELPVSFGLEALKAQAVAARNYALRPRVKENSIFDLCDSVQAQVYFGVNTEKPLSDKAVLETSGLLGLYEGDMILALYSSTAGGYTESYENAFSEMSSKKFPANPLPYLKGKPDIEGIPCLSCEEEAKAFYTSVPETFDNASGYFRWQRSWTEQELRKELNAGLNKYSNSDLINPKFEKNTDIGRIKKIEVLSRGVSGKIIEVFITAENGCWSIKKELVIRRIFTNMGKALPSANVVFVPTYDENENLINVGAFGGGLGHGVGMSQYGAGYMSKNGYTFDQILKHYYDGISIGTRPVFINSQIKQPIKEKFFSPTGKADLLIDNMQAVEKFNFMINSNKIILTKKYLPRGKIRMPLDSYIKKELNEMVFYPLEQNNKSIKVWVEVFKTDE